MKSSSIFLCCIILIGCKDKIVITSNRVEATNDSLNEQVIDSLGQIQRVKPVRQRMGIGVIEFEFSNDSAENIITFMDSLHKTNLTVNVDQLRFSVASDLPIAFHDDFGLLIFNVIDTFNGKYKINESTPFQKIAYLPRADKRFKYESWRNHILNVFAVDFDTISNPIKTQPTKSSERITLSESIYGGYIFFPVEIKNDWLKIKWENDFEKEEQTGWINWRDGNYLIFELFNFA